jgi:transcriptional regulator with XRE-family HTH domain
MITRMKQKSPIQQVRESLGLSRREGALAAGVSYHALYEIETGLVSSISEPIRRLLEQAGIDVDDLEERQWLWLENQGAGIRTRIEENRTIAGTSR